MAEQGFPRLTDEGIRYRVLVHPSRDLTDPPQIGQQVLSLWGHTVLDSSQSRRFWVRWRPEQPMESWPVYTGVKAVERDALATDKIAKGYAPARAGPNKELIVTDGDIVEAWDFLTGSASLAPRRCLVPGCCCSPSSICVTRRASAMTTWNGCDPVWMATSHQRLLRSN